MKKAWLDLSESDVRQLLISLIGYTFGQEPEKRIPDIKVGRRGYANMFIEAAEISGQDTVLDIGSGCGFGTYWLAQKARKVIGCDISPAYLSFASKECADVDNIEFHLVKNRDLSILEDNSVDVAIGMSVFIHMNIYDIYWYFNELKNKLTSKGRICIDFADVEDINFADENDEKHGFFRQAAKAYKADPDCLFALMQWNSEQSIVKVAEYFNFELVKRTADILLFQKRS